MTGTSNCQEILQKAAGQMRGAGGTSMNTSLSCTPNTKIALAW